MEQPVVIRSQPGIKRDGSRFDGGFYTDGEWVRFQRGLPRKIGGYRNINPYINGIVRQFHTQAQGGLVYTHAGHNVGIDAFTIDNTGNTSAPIARTPAGFVVDANYNWQIDAMRDSAGTGNMLLFAHPSRTLADISDATDFPVYYGNIYTTAALTSVGQSVSGGCVVLHPYLFIYGNNGIVKWSDVGNPTDFATGDAGNATIDSAKIVKGLPLRGGGQAPAGLFWTLNSLVRCSYVGNPGIFAFDTITSQTSILSSNSVIEYDGVFYWCGLDRFILYNGTVRDVPNELNVNFFFDNLNYAVANKVFAFKVPRFGEIWWCFPKGSATECNHAVIYNVRENTWYDTPLPEGGRSAGLYAQVFRSPLLAGVQAVSSKYKVWRHEVGVDAIDGASMSAIRSYFETGDLTLLTSEPPTNAAMRITAVEPDFVQTGNMTVQVSGYINTKSQDVISAPQTFPAVAMTPAEQVVKMKEVRRHLRLRFESNDVGGDYQMGKTIAHIGPADSRVQS